MYVKIKERTLREKLNFRTNIYHFPSNDVQVSQIKELISSLNDDSTVHGILVQLPLPDHLREEQDNLLQMIDLHKDVDGLRYPNSSFIPCAAQGILWLLDWYNVKLPGKHVVVVGASKLVGNKRKEKEIFHVNDSIFVLGEPVGLLCKSRGATVTFCTVQTRDLQDHFQHADIIISVTGQPHLIHGDHLPQTNRPLVIIDAGVSSKPPIIRGDVHIESVRRKCTLLTPPTGAVGKMTIAALAYNLYQSYNLCNVYKQLNFYPSNASRYSADMLLQLTL